MTTLEQLDIVSRALVNVLGVSSEELAISPHYFDRHRIKDFKPKHGDRLKFLEAIGIPMEDYASYGRVSEKGKNRLRDIAQNPQYCPNERLRQHFLELSKTDTPAVFLNSATISDWKIIVSYLNSIGKIAR